MIYRIACRYRGACELNRAIDLDDLMQAAYEAMLRAAVSFDEAQGKSWAGWLVWYLIKEFRNLLGTHRKSADMGAVSLDEPLDQEDGGGDTRGDLIPDPSLPDSDEALLRQEITQTVCAAVDRLPSEKQRTAVYDHDLAGKEYQEIASEQGCILQAVKQARTGCRCADTGCPTHKELADRQGLRISGTGKGQGADAAENGLRA